MSSAFTKTTTKKAIKSAGSFFKAAPPALSLPALHAEYYEQRLADGVRASSVASYKANAVLWERWCAERGLLLVTDIKTADCLAFLRSQKAGGVSDRTIRNRAVIIKAALRYAYRQGYITSQRLYGYEIPKAAAPVVYMASLAEVATVMAAIKAHWSVAQNPDSRFRNMDARTFFRARDQAIFAVQVSVGLRISETLGLLLSDYSLDRRELLIRHSKTGTARAVPVSASLAPYLATWLALRPRSSSTEFLFVSEFGTQLHGPPWSRAFQRYIAFARSEKGGGHALPRITLSSIRHIPATAMAEVAGGGVYHASLLLGHSSTRVTEASYIQRRTEIIRETHTAADPLAGIVNNTRSVKQRQKKVI